MAMPCADDFSRLGKKAPAFKAVLELLPTGGFRGEIAVVLPGDIDGAASQCQLLRSDGTVLGFDTESKPVFQPGAPLNPICLVQLA